MKTKIKTIDINALEWFDKVNGNSYFAGTIIINFGMKTEQRHIMPFQYGYGDQFLSEACSVLKVAGLVGEKITQLWGLRDEGVILRYSKQTGCKQRELKAII